MATNLDQELADYHHLMDTIRGKKPPATGRTWRRRLPVAVVKAIEHVEAHPLQAIGIGLGSAATLMVPFVLIGVGGPFMTALVGDVGGSALQTPMGDSIKSLASLMGSIAPVVIAVGMLGLGVKIILGK